MNHIAFLFRVILLFTMFSIAYTSLSYAETVPALDLHKPTEWIASAPVSSFKDSSVFAYVLIENSGKQSVVLRGKTIGTYDEVDTVSLSFSIHDKLSYKAKLNGKWAFYYEGTKWNDFDNISYVFSSASPDGKQETVMYSGKREEKSYLVYNGKEFGPYTNDPTYNDYGFIENSLVKMVATVQKEGKMRIILNGKEMAEWYDSVTTAVDANAKSFAYSYRKDNKETVVKNGKILWTYDSVTNLAYAGQTKKLVYVAMTSNTAHLYVDGKKVSQGFAFIWNVMFGKAGTDYVFSGTDTNGNTVVVYNGKSSAPYESVDGLYLSEDGKNFMYFGKKNGAQFPILNNKEVR